MNDILIKARSFSPLKSNGEIRYKAMITSKIP